MLLPMRSLSIQVAGQSFSIRSDADDAYLKRLAEEVTERFRAVRREGHRSDHDFKAMAMVAIALLDELRNTEARCEMLRETARQFAVQTIAAIDELLDKHVP